MIISVIGIDPGPATGMCFLDYSNQFAPYALVGKSLLQSDADSAPIVLKSMLHTYYGSQDLVGRRYASVEKFVTGRSAGSRGKSANVTRQLVMELTEVLQQFGYDVQIRSAAEVKPWATDKRLEAAGITGPAAVHGQFRHSYDAARQALFSAVKDAKLRDPLA